MFRLHIQGLCVGYLKQDQLRVVLLNSAVRQRRIVPYHLPSLFITKRSVRDTTVAPLPSIAGRWLSSHDDTDVVGFDLSGVSLQIGNGGGLTKSGVQPGDLNHPTGNPLDWRSLAWVLQASKFLPGGKFRQHFLKLGPDTLALASITSGALEGGTPVAAGDTHYVWNVRPGYEQALTDTLDVVYVTAPALVMHDANGRLRGEVTLQDEGEAWLINESAERAKDMYRLGQAADVPANDDCFLYLEAFDAEETEKAAVSPTAVTPPFRSEGRIFSTAHCDMLLVEE